MSDGTIFSTAKRTGLAALQHAIQAAAKIARVTGEAEIEARLMEASGDVMRREREEIRASRGHDSPRDD